MLRFDSNATLTVLVLQTETLDQIPTARFECILLHRFYISFCAQCNAGYYTSATSADGYVTCSGENAVDYRLYISSSSSACTGASFTASAGLASCTSCTDAGATGNNGANVSLLVIVLHHFTLSCLFFQGPNTYCQVELNCSVYAFICSAVVCFWLLHNRIFSGKSTNLLRFILSVIPACADFSFNYSVHRTNLLSSKCQYMQQLSVQLNWRLPGYDIRRLELDLRYSWPRE